MPLYEYQCSSCGEHCEFLQAVADEPKTLCPYCSQTTLARLISAGNFHLKGGGWYVTDFRDKPKGGQPTKAEAKPETKTETKIADKKVKSSD